MKLNDYPITILVEPSQTAMAEAKAAAKKDNLMFEYEENRKEDCNDWTFYIKKERKKNVSLLYSWNAFVSKILNKSFFHSFSKIHIMRLLKKKKGRDLDIL